MKKLSTRMSSNQDPCPALASTQLHVLAQVFPIDRGEQRVSIRYANNICAIGVALNSAINDQITR
jgi:hypothetical protein